jgi:hypothetical protein
VIRNSNYQPPARTNLDPLLFTPLAKTTTFPGRCGRWQGHRNVGRTPTRHGGRCPIELHRAAALSRPEVCSGHSDRCSYRPSRNREASNARGWNHSDADSVAIDPTCEHDDVSGRRSGGYGDRYARCTLVIHARRGPVNFDRAGSQRGPEIRAGAGSPNEHSCCRVLWKRCVLLRILSRIRLGLQHRLGLQTQDQAHSNSWHSTGVTRSPEYACPCSLPCTRQGDNRDSRHLFDRVYRNPGTSAQIDRERPKRGGHKSHGRAYRHQILTTDMLSADREVPVPCRAKGPERCVSIERAPCFSFSYVGEGALPPEIPTSQSVTFQDWSRHSTLSGWIAVG